MDKILQFLNQGWVGSTLGILAIPIGVLTGWIFYRLAEKRKIPCYDLSSTVILADFDLQIEGLEIAYKDEPLRDLTITKIAFWNAGRETIRGSDVASASRLIVNLKGKGIRFLGSPNLIFRTEGANQFNVSNLIDEKSFELTFEYLDKNDGAVIQCAHNSKGSKAIEVNVKIMGGTPLKRTSLDPNGRFKFKWMSYLICLFIIVFANWVSDRIDVSATLGENLLALIVFTLVTIVYTATVFVSPLYLEKLSRFLAGKFDPDSKKLVDMYGLMR